MHKDEIKGKMKETEGKIQEKFGEMVDSPADQLKGMQKQAEGQNQEVIGKIKNAAHKAID